MGLKYLTLVAFSLHAYLDIILADEVTVSCDNSTVGVCTVLNRNELANCDNLKFYVDDAKSINELIILSQRKLHHIPFGIFTTFRELEILRIAQHKIRTLDSGRLQGAIKLQILDLSSNIIEGIPKYALDGMVNLRVLQLNHNHIRRVTCFAFVGASNIRELYLETNQIEIVEDISMCLLELEVLDLGDNRIKMMDSLNLRKLEVLNLSLNKFRLLNDTFLNGLPRLRKISLSMNGIAHIGNVFNGRKQLEDLDLSRNFIEHIKKGTFELKKLKYLDLEDNKLRSLADFNLPKLLNLNLSLNKLKTLDETFLVGLPRLKKLILSMNGISDVGNVFSINNKLKKLDLSANNIEAIAEGTLNLPKLINLDLGWNKLKIVNDTLLRIMYNLRTINLERNEISHIDNAFSGLVNLTELNLSGNNLKNGNIENLHFLFGYNVSSHEPFPAFKLRKLSLDGNSISMPDIFKRLAIFPQLEELNVNSNKFQTLSDVHRIREYLPNIRNINFIDNTPSLCDWIYENRKWLRNINVYGSTKHEVCSNKNT